MKTPASLRKRRWSVVLFLPIFAGAPGDRIGAGGRDAHPQLIVIDTLDPLAAHGRSGRGSAKSAILAARSARRG